jgi:molecular chaperone GrpE
LNRESNNKKEKQTEEKPVNDKQEEPETSQNEDVGVTGNSEKELKTLRKQLEEEKDRCLRLNAEFENQRKRLQKEKEEFVKYANE